MCILDLCPDAHKFDIRVLATDVDINILAAAKGGIFQKESLDGLRHGTRLSYLKPLESNDRWRVCKDIRDLVTFRELNLVHDWPFHSTFDVIFCRNVVIYFDENTQAALFPRFARALSEDGWLFLGHSERLPDTVETRFLNAGITTFRPKPRHLSGERPCH